MSVYKNEGDILADYLFPEKFDNTVHDISYDHIRELYSDNVKEEREGRKITESSYRGEHFYDKYDDVNIAL